MRKRINLDNVRGLILSSVIGKSPLEIIQASGQGLPESGIQAGLPGVGKDVIRHFQGKGQANQLSLDDELELKTWKEVTK